MHDFRRLAVHDAGPDHHLGPGHEAEHLMPEADAEHRDLRIEDFEEVHAIARILGMAGAGGDADHVQGRVLRHFKEPGIVVPDDNGLLAQRVESLNEIVGERIVIIDEQEHGLLRSC